MARNTTHYNRFITIKRITEKDDGIGGRSQTITPLRDMYANVKVNQGGEKYANEEYVNHESVTFKIRFIHDVRVEDIVEYRGAEYDITNIQELGRRSELVLHTYRKLNDGTARDQY